MVVEMQITEKQIRAYLDTHNFRHSQLGFGYLVQGIMECTKDPTYRNNTGSLYRRVAELSQSTPSRVERAIRHAIESSDYGKVTNCEFIARTLDTLEDQE